MSTAEPASSPRSRHLLSCTSTTSSAHVYEVISPVGVVTYSIEVVPTWGGPCRWEHGHTVLNHAIEGARCHVGWAAPVRRVAR